MEEIPEFNLKEALRLLNFIDNKLKNMNEKVLEIQVEQQKVIMQSLKQ